MYACQNKVEHENNIPPPAVLVTETDCLIK